MAVTITAAELAAEIAADPIERAERILAAATAMVERYAPGAPTEIQNESVIRLGGWLAQSDYGGIRSEGEGGREVSYFGNHAAAFRNSGAAMLLAPWRKRRALVI